MEINNSHSPEKSDPVPATSAEQCSSLSQSRTRTYDLSQSRTRTRTYDLSQSRTRTYDCNFCKRGFTNAQALGGHMNIHRKEKAKLKKSSPITESRPQQFLEIPKTTLSPASNLVPPTISTISERRAAVDANWTRNYCSEKNDTSSTGNNQSFVGELRQFPFFNKTTLKVNDQNQKHSEKELFSSSNHGYELDLELRLGHEPTSDSLSAAKGTSQQQYLV